MAFSVYLNEGISPDPDHSPGVVRDDEYLIREMCDPGHFENGVITTAAISLRDLISEGVSVHRKQYTSIEFIRRAVKSRCENRQGWKEYVSLLKVEEVRAIIDEGKQVFRVIDKPTTDNPGHAHIYVFCPENIERPQAYTRKMRSKLLPLLQNYMSVDVAFHTT